MAKKKKKYQDLGGRGAHKPNTACTQARTCILLYKACTADMSPSTGKLAALCHATYSIPPPPSRCFRVVRFLLSESVCTSLSHPGAQLWSVQPLTVRKKNKAMAACTPGQGGAIS